jgi:transposase-like protein
MTLKMTDPTEQPDPEVTATPRRRVSAKEKLRILEEVDACTEPGEIGALVRREGIYSSYLSRWRCARASSPSRNWRRAAHSTRCSRRSLTRGQFSAATARRALSWLAPIYWNESLIPLASRSSPGWTATCVAARDTTRSCGRLRRCEGMISIAG